MLNTFQDNRHQKLKTVIPETEETNEVSSTTAPAYCLTEFLGHCVGRGNPNRTQ